MEIDYIRSKSLFTAIKTPFLADGGIDWDSYDYLVEEQIKHGVDGLIVGGTTGEGHLLDWEEHLMLISHTVNKYSDQLVVVGNTGSNNTREAVKATEYGFAAGMHAALLINPYYGKTTQEGVAKHILAALNRGPALIYNVPGRTGQDIEPKTMQVIAENQNFIGVKECAGNQRIGEYEKRGIACWSGNDDQCFAARHQFNCHGVISVTSNLVPGLMRKLMDTNDNALNQRLTGLYDWLFETPNPQPLNTALAMTRAIKPIIRLPYLPLGKTQRQKLQSILSEFAPNEIVGGHVQLLEDSDFKSII